MNRLLKVGLRNDPDVKTLQMLLNKHLKLNPPLVVDGAFGDNTYSAAKRYQIKMNLGVDGIVGPKTWGLLTASVQKKAVTVLPPRFIPLVKKSSTPVVTSSMQPVGSLAASPEKNVDSMAKTIGNSVSDQKLIAINSDEWMSIAWAEKGVEEAPGEYDHNPRIIEYHAATSGKHTKDETPWCSAFANWVMKKAGFKGSNSAMARSWIGWGKKSALINGAIIVVADKKDIAKGGNSAHVGFLVSETANYYELLGGNQMNKVKTSYYYKTAWTLLDCRWPTEANRAEVKK